ncbi:MAG: cell envelope integrity protein TolA [Rhizobacter sp.]
MNTATVQHNDFKPQGKDGMGSGLLLAALVHGCLIVALAFGVSWRASEPEGVEAELWAAVPQVAAQRAVEPEPPAPKPVPKPEPKPEPAPPPKVATPDPQIAIEKAKQEKLKEKQKRDEEQEKLDKKKTLEEKAKLAKADADRLKKQQQQQLEAQREANIKRILGDANATGNSAGTAARTAGPSAAYAGRIKAYIKPNILLTDTVDGNPTAEVEVQSAPDGTIISRKLIKSSGVKEWDAAVLRAIDKTEILPRDTDGSMPSPMVIAFKPRDF